MTEDEAAIAVIQALESLAIPYMIVGSLSSNYWGTARATKDADFVVHWQGASILQLAKTLGSAFLLDPQTSFETVGGALRHIFKIPGIRYTIEVFELTEDPHNQERFRRRVRVPLAGHSAFIPTPEDAIIQKLRWLKALRRPKDLGDLKSMLGIQQDTLDWNYLHRWCDIHETRQLLDDIRRTLPPQ